MVISDLMKRSCARETDRQFFFWRDSSGHEVDCITETSGKTHAIEIKSTQTIKGNLLDGLRFFESISGDDLASTALVYGGTEAQSRRGTAVVPQADLATRRFPWE